MASGEPEPLKLVPGPLQFLAGFVTLPEQVVPFGNQGCGNGYVT